MNNSDIAHFDVGGKIFKTCVLHSNKWQDKEPVFIDRSGDIFTLEMMDIYSERVTLIWAIDMMQLNIMA